MVVTTKEAEMLQTCKTSAQHRRCFRCSLPYLPFDCLTTETNPLLCVALCLRHVFVYLLINLSPYKCHSTVSDQTKGEHFRRQIRSISEMEEVMGRVQVERQFPSILLSKSAKLLNALFNTQLAGQNSHATNYALLHVGFVQGEGQQKFSKKTLKYNYNQHELVGENSCTFV